MKTPRPGLTRTVIVQAVRTSLPGADRVDLPISPPFILMGKLQGKTIRVLFDTGAQISLVDRSAVRRLQLDTVKISTPVGVSWGGKGSRAPPEVLAVTQTLPWWSKAGTERKLVDAPSTTYLVADLRVDFIFGLPAIQKLFYARVDLVDELGNALLIARTVEGGVKHIFPTTKSKRITCSAAAWRPEKLKRVREDAGPAKSVAKDELHDLGIRTIRHFRAQVRRREYVDCGMVYLVPVEPGGTADVSAASTQDTDPAPAVDTGQAPKSDGQALKSDCQALKSDRQALKSDPLDDVPASLKATVKEFLPTLFKEPDSLPPDRGNANFAIELEDPDARPVFEPLRHLSPDNSAELKKQIDALLEKGYIQHSTSPWGAPVLFAKKKDGSMRCCIDYRRLNALTRKDRTPLPNLAELRDRTAGKKFFTSIDIRDAYHCVRVRPEDVPKTAIRTRFGHFEYLVMPFGLTNAPATFQRLTNQLLGHLFDKFIISYLDDILIYSDTEEEHVEHVRRVFEILAKNSLYIKLSKCKFMQPEVEFCGHIIGRHGMKIAPSKLEVLQNWPTPRNFHDIQSFLGFTNYLCQFVNGYADIALPLSTGSARPSRPRPSSRRSTPKPRPTSSRTPPGLPSADGSRSPPTTRTSTRSPCRRPSLNGRRCRPSAPSCSSPAR